MVPDGFGMGGANCIQRGRCTKSWSSEGRSSGCEGSSELGLQGIQLCIVDQVLEAVDVNISSMASCRMSCTYVYIGKYA